ERFSLCGSAAAARQEPRPPVARYLRTSLLTFATVLASIAFSPGAEPAAPLSLTPRLHHLRIAGPREWSDFPAIPESSRLELKFISQRNASEATLVFRQQDVKQPWKIRLNDRLLGELTIDENDMVVALRVPADVLRDGDNVLLLEQDNGAKTPDDIRVGEMTLDRRPRPEVLGEATVKVEVLDVDTGRRIPVRITIVNDSGALQSLGTSSDQHLAVRPGVVYTGDGNAVLSLPAGKYVVSAGRGFEYSLASQRLELLAGESKSTTLSIRREVPTEGWVACDTHVHTLTFSGHGDATIEERMLTLAGEGIELPISTDHNKYIDFEPFARKLGMRKHFTPVVGNEVTTPFGHFNIFPTLSDATPAASKTTDWTQLFAGIYSTPRVKGVILNHARDLHSNVRPFGPREYNAVVAEFRDGRVLRANAMEIVNSGAVQSDILRLPLDWMGQLNSGRSITPVGASDSHDVARYFVGQGRTYIQARDDDPGDLNPDEATTNFVQGRVMVSYGLLAELTVNQRYGPGELVPAVLETVTVSVRVLGPHWVRAHTVRLYANGELIREEKIDSDDSTKRERGILWKGDWDLPRPRHDVHLVAMAIGPGIDGLHWKTSKPYQPTSPDWNSSVFGVSGAVWLDVDGDGRPTPAVDYARRILAGRKTELRELLADLAPYDAAIAAHAAHAATGAGWDLTPLDAESALDDATPNVRAGFRRYFDACRETRAARGE
ncbi:MAG: CehA/McbA family metallohydrolase, partial [Planctomycetota bacterium]|nr:CehA/McbA family metallohydrolase [Planctomycetota bacterium]